MSRKRYNFNTNISAVITGGFFGELNNKNKEENTILPKIALQLNINVSSNGFMKPVTKLE